MNKFGTTTRRRKRINSGDKRPNWFKSLSSKFTSKTYQSVGTKDKPKQPKIRNGGNPLGRGGRPGGNPLGRGGRPGGKKNNR
tara:strand:- start:269 stop:514 length:246 start_codon:yes stop_codon:yes gene_type:complete